MKTTRIMAVAVLIVGSGLALHSARAQPLGVKRTDLQRHDLSVPKMWGMGLRRRPISRAWGKALEAVRTQSMNPAAG